MKRKRKESLSFDEEEILSSEDFIIKLQVQTFYRMSDLRAQGWRLIGEQLRKGSCIVSRRSLPELGKWLFLFLPVRTSRFPDHLCIDMEETESVDLMQPPEEIFDLYQKLYIQQGKEIARVLANTDENSPTFPSIRRCDLHPKLETLLLKKKYQILPGWERPLQLLPQLSSE